MKDLQWFGWLLLMLALFVGTSICSLSVLLPLMFKTPLTVDLQALVNWRMIVMAFVGLITLVWWLLRNPYWSKS